MGLAWLHHMEEATPGPKLIAGYSRSHFLSAYPRAWLLVLLRYGRGLELRGEVLWSPVGRFVARASIQDGFRVERHQNLRGAGFFRDAT